MKKKILSMVFAVLIPATSVFNTEVAKAYGYVLSYGKIGMEYGEHIVEIGIDQNSVIAKDKFPLIKLDAIDIDDDFFVIY